MVRRASFPHLKLTPPLPLPLPPVPELGKFVSLKDVFKLDNNAGLCGYTPTQVASLSDSIASWDITTGNSLGTPCCEVLAGFNCLPITGLPANDTTALDWSTGAYTGTLPTEIARLTALTTLILDSNSITGWGTFTLAFTDEYQKITLYNTLRPCSILF